MRSSIIDSIVAQLQTLPDEAQLRVLAFARALATPPSHGVPGRRLLVFAGIIPPDDLQRMQHAIEERCERIDADEW